MAILHSARVTTRAQLETGFREIARLPYPYMLVARERTRTDDQNDALWPRLRCFQEQTTLKGQKLRDDQWKAVFLKALGHECEMLPTLDEKSWFAAGLRSSTLGVKEFSDLLELIQAEAAQRGVEWEKAE